MAAESPQDKLRASLVRALQEVERLRKKVGSLEQSAHEPIAIVGIGLRLPGGIVDLSSLWTALENQLDAVVPIPRSRWDADLVFDEDPEQIGKSYVRHAAFLDAVDTFDPSFFNISPREAVAIDPQHRLLLEATWEALEDAGIVPGELRETKTGVFVGIGPSDYARVTSDAFEADAHGVMTHAAFAAGRVAFTLGLQGPAVSLDTACSSSLTALHLACNSLRADECTLALAAGVQVLAAPDAFILLSRTRAVAPDGRSKTFSDHANGYGRGEGVVVVALERLSAAEAKRHRVLAVVRGSAVNHDGPSSSITAPNGTSQQKVLRAALADAQMLANDVDVVECHGTGTSLGDPIEVQALAAVYGEGRTKTRPLVIGALKTNIGHLESAAGLAGVAKVIAAMRHGMLPATIHTRPRNHHIDWEALPVEVADELRPWPSVEGKPLRAGVSAFGLAGTNAHVILESVGAPQPRSASPVTHELPLILSGRTRGALQGQVARLREWISTHSFDLRDLAGSLVRQRSPFEYRLAVAVRDSTALDAELNGYLEGRRSNRVVESMARPGAKLAMLFTGQGSQRLGMGGALLDVYPVYRAAFEAACEQFDRWLDRPVRDVMLGDDPALLDRTVYTQSALFAVEVAMVRLFESWGIRPDVVLGHSIGEISAAHVAGVLSLEDACKLVAARGRLMDALPEGGAMAAVQASEAEVVALLAEYEGVDIAGLNDPMSTVLSGDEAPVLALAKHFQDQRRKTTRLTVSHAFHSHRMDGMLAAFREVVKSLRFEAPTIAIVSNVTGELAKAEELASPEYWVKHVRQAVRFVEGVRTLEAQGVTAMLELGPHGVLTAMASACLSEAGQERTAMVVSLRKDRSETETIALAIGSLHGHGIAVDWEKYFEPFGARRVDLPTYAFQRQRYWLEASKIAATDVAGAGQESGEHPLLGAMVRLADSDGYLFTGRLSLEAQPWIADHVVFEHVLFPGTGFLDLALHAGARVGSARLEELAIEAPLILAPRQAIALQVAVTPKDDAGRRGITVHSKPEGAQVWTRHAAGQLVDDAPVLTFEPREWPPARAIEQHLADFHARLASSGLAYGPTFRGLRRAWSVDGVLHAEVRLPDGLAVEGHALHPALLDAALHALALGQPGEGVALPFAWSGVNLEATDATELRVRFSPVGTGAFAIDLADGSGRPLGRVDMLSTRPASASTIRDALARRPLESLYRVEWRELPLAELLHAKQIVVGDPAFAQSLGLAGVDSIDSIPEGVELVLLPCMGSEDSPLAATVALLQRLQAWFADEHRSAMRLVVVTRRAIAVGLHEDLDLIHAPLWGLVRTAQSEHPDRNSTILDIDDDPASLAALPVALANQDPQLAVRGGRALVPRLVAASLSEVLAFPSQARACYLETPVRGTLENLQFVAHDELFEPLGAGQVRIEVRATGLNFRDVLNALGMYPGDPGPLGYEGAGVVVAVGPGVGDLAIGERVFGLLRAGFGTHSVIDRRMVAPMPARWSFVEAAAVPLVFLTAYYALIDLANLKAGERILIHAAAGGVGMAATQVARHLGAEVFATASPGKWDTLRCMGFDDRHISNSRTLEFESHFSETTRGEGVDVVLDALAHEFVDASLRLLPRGGRFVEMGKVDVRDPAEVAREHAGVIYRSFDLIEAGFDRISVMLRELIGLFERGVLELPPITSWDVRRAVEAFRYVGQAKHIGKVVLEAARRLDPHGTVLITGATGGLGSELARHLVERGVTRSLVLVSRSGDSTPEARALVEDLERGGAKVTIAACDVGDRASVAEALAKVPSEHPLTAIIHTAGVVDDGLLRSLDAERFAKVFRAKVDAVRHLDELSAGTDLAAFVVFSSVAGVLGSAGQANYAAANAYLDATCEQRRRRGLPALSLAWGPWAGGGMAARLSSGDRERMRRQGMPALEMDEGMRLLDVAMQRPEPSLVPVRLDVQALGRAEVIPVLLRGLVRSKPARVVEADSTGLEQRLGAIPPEQRQSFMLEFVRNEAATVLGLSAPEALATDQPLQDHGLDSLMAVELRNRLQSRTQLRLPSTLLFDYPTPAAIADYLLGRLAPSAEPPKPDGDEQLRQKIASIPLAKLRESGLLGALLQLTEVSHEPRVEETIDEMSVDDLINLALSSDD